MAPASLAAEPVILILGDSLTAGYGVDRKQRWVDLLRQRLDREGHEHRVVNAAITGDTTRGGLTRLPTALERSSLWGATMACAPSRPPRCAATSAP